jgi:hypothetical protein
MILMRIWFCAMGALVVGLAAGIGSAWYEVELTPRQFEPSNMTVAASEAKQHESERLGPKVEAVDGTAFDFGSGQRNSKGNHTFVVRNIGDEPLTLTKGSSSCKCTLSELKQGKILPGESTEISLEWHLTTEGEQFRQTAEIYTNDPRQPTLLLVAQGTVIDWVKLEPRELVLSDISGSEGTQVGFSLYGYEVDSMSVVEHRFEHPETAGFFDLSFAEHDPSSLDMKPAPSVLLRATLTVKPGLPLGPLNQTIHLKTDIEQAPELELPISGSVVGDISVVGTGLFRQQVNLLTLGQIDGEKGIETTLRILVKGPHRHDVHLKIKEVEPSDVLAVQLGESVPINNGAVYMHPLTVSIPKGSRPVTRMGYDREDYGRIVIETTHPDTPLLRLGVRFAVK